MALTERLDAYVAALLRGDPDEVRAFWTADVAGETEHVVGNYFLRWERSEDGAWRIDGFVGGPTEAPDP